MTIRQSEETIDQMPKAPTAIRAATLIRWALVGLGLIVLARYLADSPGISSSSTWSSGLRLTIPILVVAMGGLFSERAGIVNVGLEGMMIGGTWMAGLFGFWAGPWAALLGGVIGGLLYGTLMAFLCIELGLNQLVVGVAVNVIAAAFSRFMSEIVFATIQGGSVSRSPRFDGSIPDVSIPFLSGGFGTPDLTRAAETSGLPIISQLGGIIGGLTRDVSLATMVGLLLVPVIAWVLWRTPFGLRWRASGERPIALATLGGSVHVTRWIALLLSSGLAGFAGGYLVLISRGYVESQTAGRGFVGLATLIFGNWMPSGVFLGSSLFGFSDAVGLGRPETVRALVFILAGAFLLIGVSRLIRRRGRSSTAPLVLGVVLISVFFFAPIPTEISSAGPYLVTLFVLIAAGTNMRPPAALGEAFPRKMSRHS